MKNKPFNFRVTACLCLLCIALFAITGPLSAQDGRRVTGHVIDDLNEPLIGASILVVGTGTGVITDLDGNFSILVPPGATTLQISYVGYETITVAIPAGNVVNVKMQSDAQMLSDVVVIGYGTQRKSDLTGSVSNVSSKDFNAGLISSPEQLINGKVSGVQILSNSGSPTAGSSIRIRGGASLNASNDPLIVLDGVPLETGGISGNSGNFLSLINPNDIESMTILKDASSTAIYGSRASNGVVLITTKKGSSDKLKVSFNTTNSIQVKTKVTDMLSTDEFISIVKEQGTAAQQALLGNERTDWNKEIYQAAYGTDNNLSMAGRLGKHLPFRVSLGYYNQNGVLKTDNVERFSGNISLSPSFFNDYLKFNINVKASSNNNRFANTEAIWGGAAMNPTIPVYSGSSAYGGYNEAIDNKGEPVTGALANPVGLLNQYKSTSEVKRVVGNIDMDYKMHFLPELKFHTTLGYDYAEGEGHIYIPADAFSSKLSGGRDYTYGPQKNLNKLLTTYLNYNKTFKEINSNFDITAGYDYQYWKATSGAYAETNVAGEVQSKAAASDQRHVLISFYGRFNYSYASRYMLTATMRRDGTSRFSKNNRWGTFPSVALGWRITEEEFLKDNAILSNLKLRASYGVTGQQDGIGNYSYLPVYTYSQDGAEYLFGDTYYHTYRPEAYVSNRKWETTTSWNLGLDFGFLDNRISGSLDFYTRRTKDLLATVASPAGTNFDKTILTNVGNVDSKGIELTLNATPVDTKNFTWDVSFNATWLKNTVQNLSLIPGTEIAHTPAGPQIDNNYIQVLTEGYEPYMFFVYHQLYDEATGKPIEGAYADLNDDGMINSDDLYHYHSASPDYILGFSTSLRYKKWTLGMSFRSNIGNYVFNGMAMNTGAWETMSYNPVQLNNLNRSYLETGFQTRQFLSDHYVENASFLKMDNLTLGYNVGKISKWCSLNLSAMVQNVFCITKYSGVDPEISNGLDMSFYPRPRIFSLSVGLEF